MERRPSVSIPSHAAPDWKPRCPTCGRFARLVGSNTDCDDFDWPIVDCILHGEKESA